MRRHMDLGTLLTIGITLVLFAVALVVKGLTHDLLLEAGVFLVSVKLVIATYKSSVGTETLLVRIDQLGSAIARLEPAAGLALSHAITCEQRTDQRDRAQQSEDDVGRVHPPCSEARGRDVQHLVDGRQQLPGELGTRGCLHRHHSFLPDLVLQGGGLGHWRPDRERVGNRPIDRQAGLDVLPEPLLPLLPGR
jgi:hypothetical protein